VCVVIPQLLLYFWLDNLILTGMMSAKSSEKSKDEIIQTLTWWKRWLGKKTQGGIEKKMDSLASGGNDEGKEIKVESISSGNLTGHSGESKEEVNKTLSGSPERKGKTEDCGMRPHPNLTGTSAVMGLYLFGVGGVVKGPVLLWLTVILVDLLTQEWGGRGSLRKKRHNGNGN